MKTILIFFNQVRTCFGGNNQKRGKLLQSILIERLMIFSQNLPVSERGSLNYNRFPCPNGLWLTENQPQESTVLVQYLTNQ